MPISQSPRLIVLLFTGLFSLASTHVSALITPTDVLTASDGAVDDHFGWSVDIDGNTAIVGAYLDDDVSGTNATGSAYIYVNDGAGNWTEQQQLPQGFLAPDDTNSPPDADTDPDFISQKQRESGYGYSVAIHGDIAVVGSPFYDIDSEDAEEQDFIDAGAVSIYERSGTVWSLKAFFIIDPDDAKNGDWFGSSVDVYNNTVVVGAQSWQRGGFVMILFKDTTGDWKQQFAQNADEDLGIEEVKDLQPLDPESEDWFGQSVAIHNNTIVVGSDGSDDPDTGSGSAYVFTRDDNSNWNFQAKLLPSDVKAFAGFGVSVDVNGNDIIVGADNADSSTSVAGGAAYIFSRNFEGTWTQQVKLTASDAEADDKFGRSVSLSSPLALVGAWNEGTNGIQAGSAYLYQKSSTGTWSAVDTIRDSSGSTFDNFGFSVAVSSINGLSDYWAIMGAPQKLDNANGMAWATANLASLINTDGADTSNDTDADHDNDGIPNINDDFPYDASSFSDIDRDGFGDEVDQFPNNPIESADSDLDGLGNNYDTDDDNDGVSDANEFLLGSNPLLADSYNFDSPLIDTDGDGVFDNLDAFPQDPDETLDTDLDGIGNNTDTDDDNDGILDTNDALPLDSSVTTDSDPDATGTAAQVVVNGDSGAFSPLMLLMLCLSAMLLKRRKS